MRKVHLVIAAIIISISGILYACSSATSKEKEPFLNQTQLVARGQYLVNGMGCDDCHSPKRMGAQGPEIISELRFSGYPANRPIQKTDTGALKNGWILFGGDGTNYVGPWGMSFAANISSDETGIGNWTEEHFFNAMRHGKVKGIMAGRSMLPPMPWAMFKNLNDEDLKAIFAYLKTSVPVSNMVPQPVPPQELK